jgi:hypothetical protein
MGYSESERVTRRFGRPFQNFTGNAANPLRKMLGLQRSERDGIFNRRFGKRLNRVVKAICPSMRANGAPKQK